jgi:hypothetical protein
MTALAVIRPDAWNLALFLHILGALVLIGALTLGAVYLAGAWRGNSPALTRAGFLAIFYGAIPGWIVMRGGAQWIASKEHLDGEDIDLTWLNIGFTTADLGFILLIVLTIIGGQMVRRVNRGREPSAIATRISTGLVSLLLIAYLVTVWAMTTKPD